MFQFWSKLIDLHSKTHCYIGVGKSDKSSELGFPDHHHVLFQQLKEVLTDVILHKQVQLIGPPYHCQAILGTVVVQMGFLT